MKLPTLKVAEENKPAFEKRLLVWTLMRDTHYGWHNLASYFKIDQQCRGNKRIRKKRAIRKLMRMVWADLQASTGLEITYAQK